MSSSSSSLQALSGLLSSTPHLLAYSIPLLIFSVLLNFAGTFLTLDRSRSFPPSSSSLPLPGAFDPPPKRLNFTWFLRGGIGGLATGYVFGLHLSTFLALLIPAVSTSHPPLSSNAFIAVWVLSCISTTVLGARFEYCALFFSAVSGGAFLALGLSVIFHPALLSRIVLVALFSIAFLIAIFVFSFPQLSRFLHRALRISTSSTGAFGLTFSIALLAHIPAWANFWERLWVSDGDSWGTSQEKGLNAAFCIFMIIGIGTDWLLRRRLGECPDEKWDQYLAKYMTCLSNDSSRAGIFKPLPSIWERIFHSNDKKDTLFPASPKHSRTSISKDDLGLLSGTDDDYAQDPTKTHHAHHLLAFPVLHKHSSPTALMPENKKVKRKTKKVPGSRRHKRIKFGGDLDSASSDSEFSSTDEVRPWLKQKASMSSSTPTLVEEYQHMRPSVDYDLDVEISKLKKGRAKAGGGTGGDLSDCSDYEGDLGLQSKVSSREGDVGDKWSPGFMKRHSSSSASASVSGQSNQSTGRTVPLGAVPATPSLIKALDRVSEAQREAFGVAGGGLPRGRPPVGGGGIHPLSASPSHKARVDGLPRVEEQATDKEEAIRDDVQPKKPRWDDFWRDVTEKARS